MNLLRMERRPASTTTATHESSAAAVAESQLKDAAPPIHTHLVSRDGD